MILRKPWALPVSTIGGHATEFSATQRVQHLPASPWEGVLLSGHPGRVATGAEQVTIRAENTKSRAGRVTDGAERAPDRAERLTTRAGPAPNGAEEVPGHAGRVPTRAEPGSGRAGHPSTAETLTKCIYELAGEGGVRGRLF